MCGTSSCCGLYMGGAFLHASAVVCVVLRKGTAEGPTTVDSATAVD